MDTTYTIQHNLPEYANGKIKHLTPQDLENLIRWIVESIIALRHNSYSLKIYQGKVDFIVPLLAKICNKKGFESIKQDHKKFDEFVIFIANTLL